MKIKLLLLIFFSSFLLTFTLHAQVLRNVLGKKEPKKFEVSNEYAENLLKNVKSDISYLTSDEVEGRKAGTRGEQLAGMYIQNRMIQSGLTSYNNNFVHAFKFVSGKFLTPETRVTVAEKVVFVPEEAFPVSFSAEQTDKNYFLPNSEEAYSPWVIPLFDNQQEADNPLYDWEKSAFERAKKAIERGASSIIFYDEYDLKNSPEYIQRIKFETLEIPVVIFTKKAYDKHLKNVKSIRELSINIKYRDEYKTGHNVIGFINNNASLNVVIMANYDYLGFESDPTLPPNKNKRYYKGTDDNSSGIAAMLSLADMLPKSNFNKYNYIFIAFSGKEMGLSGSKAFIESLKGNFNRIAYVINFDKVGRMDSGNKLYVNGEGSSPLWKNAVNSIPVKMNVVAVNVVNPYSDFSSFYSNNIPGLVFSSGAQKEHKTYEDLPALINYKGIQAISLYAFDLIGYMNERPSPRFMEIREEAIVEADLSVSLGIIPDYDYSGIGLLIESVLEKSLAEKMKLLEGDIILQFNEQKINKIADYMELIKTLNKGDQVHLKIKRGPTVQEFNGVF